MDIQRAEITEGITLYLLPDHKFKNCIQGVYFTMPLEENTATAFALMPKVLMAGNAEFGDRTALYAKLENMYGAKLHCGTDKVGETQVISFVGDSIADAYAKENLFVQMQELVSGVICNPKIREGAFDSDIFKREKEALREEIRAVVNDKRQYALLRCAEEMCKGEPYGLRAGGREEDLEKITPASLYSLYQNMLSGAKVDIFVAGAFSEEEAREGAKKLAGKLGARRSTHIETVRKEAGEIKYIRDREAVQQGKLVIGYRTDLDPASDAYYALMVYNAVFGGGTSSKLFNHVREKMSLCYYASSALERVKGLLFVQSGIEFSKYEVALEAIVKQGEEIQKGNIEEAEFSGAVQGLINQLRSYKDAPALLMGYYRRQLPLGTITDIDTVIEKIMQVKREDVIAVSNKVHMDTVYFLAGEGGSAE